MRLFKAFATLMLAAVTLFSITAQAAEPQLSVQLWSVKDELKADFKGTLQSLADMGFDGVEFAGDFGPYANDPAGLKAFLAEIGLVASGAHVGMDKMTAEKLMQTAAFYLALGAPTLVVPWDDRAMQADGIDEMVSELTRVSEALRPYGLKTGYHNHAPEFEPYKDGTFWDYLASNTPQDVVLQLDVGWATAAGKEAAVYIRKYPGRTYTTHIKAGMPEGTKGKQPIIGKDIADWPVILDALYEVGGTHWLVVEQEVYPKGMTPMQSVKASLKGLQGYLAKR